MLHDCNSVSKSGGIIDCAVADFWANVAIKNYIIQYSLMYRPSPN